MAEFLAGSPSPDEILGFRLSDAALDRARDLLDKSKAGTLTAEEDRELDRLLVLDDLIGLIRARVLASRSNSGASAPPDSPAR